MIRSVSPYIFRLPLQQFALFSFLSHSLSLSLCQLSIIFALDRRHLANCILITLIVWRFYWYTSRAGLSIASLWLQMRLNNKSISRRHTDTQSSSIILMPTALELIPSTWGHTGTGHTPTYTTIGVALWCLAIYVLRYVFVSRHICLIIALRPLFWRGVKQSAIIVVFVVVFRRRGSTLKLNIIMKKPKSQRQSHSHRGMIFHKSSYAFRRTCLKWKII